MAGGLSPEAGDCWLLDFRGMVIILGLKNNEYFLKDEKEICDMKINIKAVVERPNRQAPVTGCAVRLSGYDKPISESYWG